MMRSMTISRNVATGLQQRPLRACRAMRVAVRRGAPRVVAFKEDEQRDNGNNQQQTDAPRAAAQNRGVASYDEDAVKVTGLPAFTRRREIFAGRLAMLGFVAAWIGEIMTGQGIIGQVQLWTGLSEMAAVVGLATLVGLNAIGGLWPNGPTFSEENQRDIQKRPAGPVQEGMDPVTTPQQYLGINGWGFTKANELFNGRVAMMGFALSVVAELSQHRGPIAQLANVLNQPVDYNLAANGLAAWSFLAFAIAYTVGNKGELSGGKDIY